MEKSAIVVCPVCNERSCLGIFIASLRGSYSGDLLLVDDGSTDGSALILDRLSDDRTFILRHRRRLGYGAALLSGFSRCLARGYERVVTMDVDLQHDPGDLSPFFCKLEEYPVVLGSRYSDGIIPPAVPRERYIINRYIASLLKVLFSVDFTDPFCGYRGYRRSFLERARLREPGYGLGLEILLEVLRTGTPFDEVPVRAQYPHPARQFLNGLNNPRHRLLYYLSIISKKRGQATLF